MRILPFPSVRPSNQMMAQSATQASPSSPNQNARTGKLFLQKENVPPIQLMLDEFLQHVTEIFGDKLDSSEWNLISQSAKKAESSSLADYFLQIIESELGFDASRLVFKQQNAKEHVVIEKMRLPATQNEKINPSVLAQTFPYSASYVSTTVTRKDIEPPHSDVLLNYIQGTQPLPNSPPKKAINPSDVAPS